METQKVKLYLTRYALTQGIIEINAEYNDTAVNKYENYTSEN